MLNFLFGVLCASGAVFGSYLTYMGVASGGYEGVIAGGIFLFGSLLTFGIGQIHRLMRTLRKQGGRMRTVHRTGPLLRTDLVRPSAVPPDEPGPFPSRAEPIIAHPVLERVASRFARSDR